MSTAATAILLAAGFGRRYRQACGQADIDKLMVPLPDGRPMVLAAAHIILATVPRMLAVVCEEDGPVARTLRKAGVRTVLAAAAGQGMGHSLAAGVAASAAASGWLVFLGDMPFVQAATIAQMACALDSPEALVAPAYRGRRGHPVGFGAAHGAALRSLTGDEGARALLRRHAAELRLIDVDDPGVLADIDLPNQDAVYSYSGHSKKACGPG